MPKVKATLANCITKGKTGQHGKKQRWQKAKTDQAITATVKTV